MNREYNTQKCPLEWQSLANVGGKWAVINTQKWISVTRKQVEFSRQVSDSELISGGGSWNGSRFGCENILIIDNIV